MLYTRVSSCIAVSNADVARFVEISTGIDGTRSSASYVHNLFVMTGASLFRQSQYDIGIQSS